MKKEIEFERICDKVASHFTELKDIIITIRDNFTEENKQDPGLTLRIINSSLGMVSSRADAFLGYKKRRKTDWPLEKYIDYANKDILDFFREFDNPFLCSPTWTPKIRELLIMLSKECDNFEKLMDMKDES